jgi:hypothetical protein
MQPFFLSAMFTAGHFFLLAGLWALIHPFLPQALFPVLGAYVLLGPLPYLWHCYVRQQRFDAVTQTLTYFSGLGISVLTVGLIWQCRIQVVEISIPMVVWNPPWMTWLLLAYIGACGFLSYLMILLSGRKIRKDRKEHPKPLVAPLTVTNPLLKGVMRTPSDPESTPKDKGR